MNETRRKLDEETSSVMEMKKQLIKAQLLADARVEWMVDQAQIKKGTHCSALPLSARKGSAFIWW